MQTPGNVLSLKRRTTQFPKTQEDDAKYNDSLSGLLHANQMSIATGL